MPKFRKKPIVIEANQWFKNGDHPQDACYPIASDEGTGFMSEGKVVRYYRTPDGDGGRLCEHCKIRMHNHGWIDTLEGGHIVCPGDWVITGIKQEMYPCKPDVFIATYEEVVGDYTVGEKPEVLLADRMLREQNVQLDKKIKEGNW